MAAVDVMEDLEWEDNPHNLPFVYHMLAGSVAGVTEHVCMFPVDTLKTHLQCEKCGSVSPLQTWRCATGIVGREGIFRLWRGVSAMFVGCIPAHAAYFSIFEGAKRMLGADQQGHTPIAAALCGAIASVSHDSIMTPFDTIKQRMQLGHYNNVVHCVRTIFKSEGGLSVLYKSFPLTLAMNIPYGGIMVAVNESMRKLLTSSSPSSSSASQGHSMSTLLLSGCVAGGVAALLTTPLDTIKTRLQVQHLQPCPRFPGLSSASASASAGVSGWNGGGGSHNNGQMRSFSSSAEAKLMYARGPLQIIKEILREEGMRGFFRGAVPRMMVHIPSVAVSWTTYDTIKKLLITEDM